MKKSFIFILIICLLFALCGCGSGAEAQEADGLQVVTTLFPAYDFARQIAGERAQIYLLVPPGTETHSFEPTARDMIRIGESDLFFYNGGESEAWAEELLESGNVKNTLCMLDCVDALEEELKEGMQEIHEEETEEEGPEYDEHVWTDPMNALRICESLCEALCRIDPEGEKTYRENLKNYGAQLRALDADFRQVRENAARDVVVFADRFPVRYFVEAYDLDYYAAFPGCADDTEASAKTVAFLIDKVRQEQVPAVFYIEFSNEKMADVLVENTSCEKLLFHSCHNVSADELEQGVSYLQLMRQNVSALKEALG